MVNREGFTLIELMIVVAIIGILAAIAIPKFADLIRKSNDAATKGNLGLIRTAIDVYCSDNDGWFPFNTVPGSMSMHGSLGNILMMEDGKYIVYIGRCYCPPYHDRTTQVDSLPNVNEGGSSGWWGYKSDNIINNPWDKRWGQVWVNCEHTDTNVNMWSSY